MKFSDLDLAPELQENLNSIGFIECMPVQAEVIPTALDGKDISALSQTGTGKTAAFLLPLMDRVFKSLSGYAEVEDPAEQEKKRARVFTDWKKGQFALVLVPTRELAEQVYQDFYKLRGATNLEAASIYGGTSYEEQKSKIGKGVQFIIGTPGRLIDLYKTHTLDLRQVRAIVFDEADRMFDMGFKEDMRFVLQRIPKDRQVLMFSATMNFEVLETVYRFGVEPIEFNLSKDQVRAENVEDCILHVGDDEKPKILLSLLKREKPKQAVIFSNFKMNVEQVAAFLTKNGIPAMGISSLLTQAQRNRVIAAFKETNDQNILVATDVAARGLDIKNVDLVINCELPDDAENYVHRIGRTGRAGAKGKAFSLVSDRDVEALMRIEEYLKHKLNVGWLEDSEIVQDFAPPSSSDNYRDKPKWDKKPSNDGPRPPRRQENRGPRPQQGSHSGPRPQANGPRRAPDAKTPHTEARTDKGTRPERKDTRRPHPNGKAPHKPHQGNRPQRPDNRHKPNSNRPQQNRFTKPQQKPAGLVGKVSTFFKSLFK